MVLPKQLICLFGKQNLFFFLNCLFQSRTLSCRFSNLPRATILLKVLISFINVFYRFRRICRIYLIGVIV